MTQKTPHAVSEAEIRKRPRVQKFPEGESRTKQSFKTECDINHILAQYLKSGQINHINIQSPEYRVVPSIDFTDAMNLVTEAQQTFDSLPSSIRNRFGNSPPAFFDFALNPANENELRELGLLGRTKRAETPMAAPAAAKPPEIEPQENNPPAEA